MKRNPLDPYAFDKEAHPFVVRGARADRDSHLGVHTAASIERAAVYAMNRALVEGTIAIVLVLDTQGLKPLPDRDAQLLADKEPFDLDDELRDALDEGDFDAVSEILEQSVDGGYFESSLGPGQTTWFDAAYAKLDDEQEQGRIATLLGMDLEVEFERFLRVGKFTPEYYMALCGQQRYMSEIGFDRVVKVIALRPVRPELAEGYLDDSEEDPDAPMVFSLDNFYDDQWMPDEVVLWSRQAPKGARLEYHGTDVARALQAFPELSDELSEMPWPYIQEQQVVTPSFSVIDRLQEIEGKNFAGVFPLAESTGRYLVGLRSWEVGEPGQWAGFGGSLNYGETLEDGAERELREEVGYSGEIEIEFFAERLCVAHVEKEFKPRLNWETEEAHWVELDEIPLLDPLHWGLRELIDRK